MELSKVLDWTLTLAVVIAQLHACDPPIVYRDLKPDNVLMDDKSRVFLGDFGITKILEETGLTTTLTTTADGGGGGGGGGGMAGTLYYMSPEQAGAEDEDGDSIEQTEKTDSWTFGTFLVRLITGKDPWMRENMPTTQLFETSSRT